jgi:hypothetical protein
MVLLAEIACGNFSGHRSFPASKKRGFCSLRPLLQIRSPNGTQRAKTTLFARRSK